MLNVRTDVDGAEDIHHQCCDTNHVTNDWKSVGRSL